MGTGVSPPACSLGWAGTGRGGKCRGNPGAAQGSLRRVPAPSVPPPPVPTPAPAPSCPRSCPCRALGAGHWEEWGARAGLDWPGAGEESSEGQRPPPVQRKGPP